MDTIKTNFEGQTTFIGMNIHKVSGFAIKPEVLWVESRQRDCQDSSAILWF